MEIPNPPPVEAWRSAAPLSRAFSKADPLLLTFLEQERDQLIKDGEASRTEAAKAQMQVERADRAAALAEEKMKVLEEKLAAALAANTDLEKRLAVTEAKREALEATERTRTTEAKERIEELKQELSGIKIALEEERKGRVEAEKQLAGAKTESKTTKTKGA